MTDKPLICQIAVLDENFAIGKDGKLIYDLPDDLAWFRQKTRSNVCIMGRKTFQSLPDHCRPLPDRPNIVISRQEPLMQHPLVYWQDNVQSALELGKKFAQEKQQKEIFVIGGSEIYNASFDVTDRLYLTMVEDKSEGDTFYPRFDTSLWSKIIVSDIGKTDDTPGYKIYQYDRIRLLR
jgi:dihydrofolate reductase